MSSTMTYKNYLGSVEFSEEDHLFYGKVLGIRALVSYEGASATELVEDFHGAVDDYLALCEEIGQAPEPAYQGSFHVHIPPELHRQAALYAEEHQLTLDTFIERALENALPRQRIV